MSIKANIFQPAKAFNLQNGTLFTREKQWYVRAQLYNEQRQLGSPPFSRTLTRRPIKAMRSVHVKA
ncbi:hypothetical protein KWH03_20010, partial [Xanthomonas campestris pv. lawsoniae]|nr:hypothetical protein [Xanthomonas campestris pv. lawsoniae]